MATLTALSREEEKRKAIQEQLREREKCILDKRRKEMIDGARIDDFIRTEYWRDKSN